MPSLIGELLAVVEPLEPPEELEHAAAATEIEAAAAMAASVLMDLTLKRDIGSPLLDNDDRGWR
jgi:hypothetical protein